MGGIIRGLIAISERVQASKLHKSLLQTSTRTVFVNLHACKSCTEWQNEQGTATYHSKLIMKVDFIQWNVP